MTNTGAGEAAASRVLEERRESVQRLTKDLRAAAATLTDNEARFLVDAYYGMQEGRKRSANQVRALGETLEPNSVLAWLAEQDSVLERQIARALDAYTAAHEMGSWMRDVRGIGPILSAGLLAHIDISVCPTVGHIWRFAGLDPTQKWGKGEKRPWNARLKTLCWKIGQSFMKLSNDEQCYYGSIYRERKAYEQARSDRGDMREYALERSAHVGKSTEAYKAYVNGNLPKGQIDARARRYAVKLFLSHLHAEWYKRHFGRDAPLPYPIAILGHAHWVGPKG